MAKNVHKVSKRQWKKWNATEQAAFNRLWREISPDILDLCGCGKMLNRKQLTVLRWNICWIVADMMKAWRGMWD